MSSTKDRMFCRSAVDNVNAVSTVLRRVQSDVSELN